MPDMSEEEVIKIFVKYVKDQKITVYAESETNTLHVFKTPKTAPWKKKYDSKRS